MATVDKKQKGQAEAVETAETVQQPTAQPTEVTAATPETAAQTPAEATQTAQPAAQETAAQTQAPAQQTETPKKKVKVTDFTARILLEGRFSQDEAIAAIRAKLQTYRCLDDGFLKKVEEKDAFEIKKSYLPIYRLKATAEYLWKTGSKETAVDHTENKPVSVILHGAEAFWNAAEIGDCKGTKLEKPKAEADLYPCKKFAFKDCQKVLRQKAEQLAPQKKAKLNFVDEEYEVLYVPVIVATCEYGGKKYAMHFNTVNGACKVEYAVSQKTVAVADKTMARVAKNKRNIFGFFAYALTFAVLAFVKWSTDFGASTATDGGLKALIMAIVLCGVSLLVLFFWSLCFIYKKQNLIDKAVKKGRVAKASLSGFLSFVSCLFALASVVIFAVLVL
ncbi:MAG: hypothetical protein IJX98_06830 [Clostridia bacterium]|nr:hypothetical protein [Clostridia bacterium]